MKNIYDDEAEITFTNGYDHECQRWYPIASHISYWDKYLGQYQVVVLYCEIGWNRKELQVTNILKTWNRGGSNK